MQLTTLDNQLRESRPLLFGTEGSGVVLGRGWHPPEANFAWTNGPFAEISLSVDRDLGSYVLSFDCAPLVMPGAKPSQILIFVNGRLCAAEVLHDRRAIEAVVNDAAVIADIVLWVPDVQSPHEIDPAFEDLRPLGARVRSVILGSVPDGAEAPPLLNETEET